MKDQDYKGVKQPRKVDVKRIEEIFESTNPCIPNKSRIIRDYVYVQHKRIIP